MTTERVLDFTTGNRGWGRTLHASTWQAAKPRRTGPFWKRHYIPRVSVMAHCQYPQVGNLVKYTTKAGTRQAIIVEIEPCGDPRDMYTLILEEHPQ